MAKLKRLTADDLLPGAGFFNKRADAIEAVRNLAVAGQLSMNNGVNNLLSVPIGVKLVMFQLTEDMQMPDPAGVSLGDSTMPFTDNANAVWFAGHESTLDYEEDDTFTYTLFHPTAIRNSADIGVGHATFFVGDRVWATFVNGRWDIISQADRIWRFELKDVLTPGGQATAFLLDKDGNEDTDQEFEVYDQVFGTLSLAIGTQGYAKFFADSERWEIIAPQGSDAEDRHYEFTLGTALANTAASVSNVTLNEWYGGAAPGSPVTIFNKTTSSTAGPGVYMFEGDIGDKGMVVYDASEDKYKIWNMEGLNRSNYYRALLDWAANSGDNRVQCRRCDRDGTNSRGAPVFVYLPRIADCDPTVFEDAVIVASISDEGILTCDSMYGDGSKIGDIRLTTLSANIRPGWREATGTGGAWDCKDRFIVGRGDKYSVGDEGGNDDHGDTADVNDHDDQPDNVDGGLVDAVGGASGGSGTPFEGNTGSSAGHTHTIAVGYGTASINTATDNRPKHKAHIVIERFK